MGAYSAIMTSGLLRGCEGHALTRGAVKMLYNDKVLVAVKITHKRAKALDNSWHDFFVTGMYVCFECIPPWTHNCITTTYDTTLSLVRFTQLPDIYPGL